MFVFFPPNLLWDNFFWGAPLPLRIRFWLERGVIRIFPAGGGEGNHWVFMGKIRNVGGAGSLGFLLGIVNIVWAIQHLALKGDILPQQVSCVSWGISPKNKVHPKMPRMADRRYMSPTISDWPTLHFEHPEPKKRGILTWVGFP